MHETIPYNNKIFHFPIISKYNYIFATDLSKIKVLQPIGEMLEWLKRHAWKACIPLKGIGGSNPPLSAKEKGLIDGFQWVFFFFIEQICQIERTPWGVYPRNCKETWG